MSVSNAWSLDLGNSIYAAVGEREMVHLITAPELHHVPKTPSYCRQTLLWQNHILPVMDLAVAIEGNLIRRDKTFAGVFAYQNSVSSKVEYGALLLASMPRRISVNDDQACNLPEQPEAWEKLAMSCFLADDRIIPILDLSRIYLKQVQSVSSYST